jgi:phage terminase Nu1 subunit (DNA packaging protein)
MATQKEIGEYIGLSDRQVRNLMTSGVLSDKRGKNGFCLKTCIHNYIQHLKQAAKSGDDDIPNPSGDTNGINTDWQDARLSKMKADKMEIELLKLLGQVAPIEMILALSADKGAMVASILDGIPAKISRAVPELPKSRLAIIEQEITKARNEATQPIDLEPYLADCFKYGDNEGMASDFT